LYWRISGRFADHVVFKLCNCGRKIALGGTIAWRSAIARQHAVEVRRIDGVSPHEYDRPLDCISEFAHVARPGMILQPSDSRRRQSLCRIGPGRKFQKMPGQQLDIAASFAQWRQSRNAEGTPRPKFQSGAGLLASLVRCQPR
jgi:hypothetical protein